MPVAWPCPCPDAIRFVDAEGVYDRPILYEPSEHFYDGIHLFRAFVDPVRRQLIAAYGLQGETREASARVAG